MHVLYGLIGIAISFAIIKYRFALTEMIGEIAWAEKYLKGTMNALIFFAVIVFIVSLQFLFGETDRMSQGVQKIF